VVLTRAPLGGPLLDVVRRKEELAPLAEGAGLGLAAGVGESDTAAMRDRRHVVLLALIVTAAFASAGPRSTSSASEIKWTAPIEVVSGTAFRGPWRMNESVFHFVDDPSVAIDARGEVGVVWADHTRKDLFFQRYGRDGKAQLDAPVNVSRSLRIFSWLPRLVLSADDPMVVYVLWQEIVFSGGSHGGEIFFARSADGGRSFDPPVNLSNSPAGDGKGRLTADAWDNGSLDLMQGPQGHLHVAWTEYEGRLWYRQSTDHGARFSAPILVAGGKGARPARGPALAIDGRGTVFLAWTVGEDAAADIRMARSSDGGRSFGEPRIVAPGPGHADAPKIAVDSKGTVHLVYAESPTGPSGRYHVRYSRRPDGAETFEAPRVVSTSVGGQRAGAGFPAVGLDGKDRLHVIWDVFPDSTGRPRGLAIASSTDGGATFSAASLVPGTGHPRDGFNGSQQGLLMRKLAVRTSGAIAVVDSTFRVDVGSRVRLFRGQAGGSR
jgi:hypothetical protein